MRAFGLFVAILVLVAMVVLPVHPALAQPPPPDPTRSLPAKVERGETFDVTINFTAPEDNFNGISLVETAPDGWVVKANDGMWCVPPATGGKVIGGNRVEFGWIGPYGKGANFTAKYKVTVPCGASLVNHSFSVTKLRWQIGGPEDVYMANVTGDHVLGVIRPTINFTQKEGIIFRGAVNGTNPQDQPLELWGSTQCPLIWNLTDDAVYNVTHDWLSETPPNGSCNYTEHSFVVLSVNSSGMLEGEYFANITITASEANNSVGIIPVTLYMSETDILEAHVSFMGRGDAPDDRWIESFEVWRFNPGTKNVVWQGNRTTNNTGWFNISDIPVGIYDIGIKNWTCLSEVASNVMVGGGVGAVVDFGTIREGDANNDDWVTIDDLSVMFPAWNTKKGNPAYRWYCDFNRDGWVTIDDMSMMFPSWNQHGDLVG